MDEEILIKPLNTGYPLRISFVYYQFGKAHPGEEPQLLSVNHEKINHNFLLHYLICGFLTAAIFS